MPTAAIHSATLRISTALLVALAAFADATTTNAQSAPPAQARIPLDGWLGELTWSMRVQTPGGSWTRFFGTAKLWLYSAEQNKLVGSISGYASMEGENRETDLCPTIKTIRPTYGWASLTGTHRRGSDVISLATERVETIERGHATPCMGVAFPTPGGEMSVALHTDTVRRQPDGTFRASATTQTTQGGSSVSNEFSLVLRPGYCGYGTDRGALYALSATSAGPKIHASPLATSPSARSIPNGSRLAFDLVVQVDGQTWFHVGQAGRPVGWVSGTDVVCGRPGMPYPGATPPPPFLGSARPTASISSAGRG